MMIANALWTTHRPSQASHQLRLAAIPVLSTAFGYAGGRTIAKPRGMTGFGVLWGVAAMVVAPRLARRSARSPGYANAPVYTMLPLAWLVLGGSILGHLAGPTPTAFLQLLRQPGYGLFFYAVHGPFEWLLMPWALIVNWSYPARRRLLVVAAGIFYLGRVTSALYFAPRALAWGRDPAEAAAHPDEVAQWIRLDLIRVIVQDAVTAVLLLVAALHPRFRPGSRTTPDA